MPSEATQRADTASGPRSARENHVGPRWWVKALLSLLICGHWFAICTAVIAAGTPQFPPPLPAVWARLYLTQPYLNFVFLTNPYRFYAPNPGPANLVWFRLEYADGSVRWLEVPDRQQWRLRMPYQRHLCVALLFDQMGESVSAQDPTVRRLSPQGKVAASSFARYVARKYPKADVQGNPIPVSRVSIYTVMHSVMEPYMVQKGWDVYDLRLYTPFYIGTFGPDGVQLDKGTEYMEYRVVSDLVAHMLATDIYPQFRKYPDRDRSEILAELGIPRPIRAMFYRFPELLRQDDMDRPNLKEIIEQLYGTEGFSKDQHSLPRT